MREYLESCLLCFFFCLHHWDRNKFTSNDWCVNRGRLFTVSPIQAVFTICNSIWPLSADMNSKGGNKAEISIRPFGVTSRICENTYCFIRENLGGLLTSWCWGDQAPVPLSIFRSNSKFDENSECSSFEYTRPITTIFCTRHDSGTVVTCAKYRCDRPRIFYTRVFWIFIEFRIRSKYA